jgi:hypothetical protein
MIFHIKQFNFIHFGFYLLIYLLLLIKIAKYAQNIVLNSIFQIYIVKFNKFLIRIKILLCSKVYQNK